MQLDHQFTVPVPVDVAWKALLDVPRVAPCMPGASLDEFDGETFSGSVKVKLGPVNLLYKGQGRFAETDESARRVVMEASGKESRGSGTAAATVTATMTPEGESTTVNVTTDLKITGRPAQFGRGMINDVGGKLLGQFADCLATTLGASETPATGGATTAGASTTAGAGGESTPDGATNTSSTRAGATQPGGEEPPSADQVAAEEANVEVEPIDLLQITGAQAAIRRYGPYAAAGTLLAVLLWIVLRRRRR
ncbi:SRPBCC family protein [Phytoactinopolyspora halotolerans]|uniref:SRPBCC family protein n=1 Tax=Phytoactinopolyspora halotolerans TaxID=1981512 RepID=A0A6L9S979_9ACTN|nr:SRPBCC family protein [Phytoactinopolyspora halotolerans]NEE01629.1 SRPBCC family protein [Phytoactinopolyspora halotolerans]